MGRLLMDYLSGLMVITCGKGERKRGVTVEEGSEGDSKFLALIMEKGAKEVRQPLESRNHLRKKHSLAGILILSW